MKIIGIGGRNKAGKTTLAYDIMNMWASKTIWQGKMPLSYYSDIKSVGLHPLAFALKKCCCDLFGFVLADMEDRKELPTHVHSLVNDDTNITYRRILQEFGTEVARRMDQDIWVKKIDQWAKNKKCKFLLIPDIRFSNEVDYCKENGVFIYLKGRGDSSDQHVSNTLDLEQNADIVIDNTVLSRESQTKIAIYELNNLGITISQV